MKVGVAFDAWKLSIFKRHLKDWKYETHKITEGENGPVVVFVFHIEVNDVEVLKLKKEVYAAVKETCRREKWRTN